MFVAARMAYKCKIVEQKSVNLFWKRPHRKYFRLDEPIANSKIFKWIIIFIQQKQQQEKSNNKIIKVGKNRS